ncbi:MAG: right-handed parallel beta-helix repeat-containing protein [Planctomycetota bacterium]
MMKSVFATLLVFITLSAFCLSKTIHVPGDYTTIRYAVQVAEEGDEVIVARGTYVENIIFQGKDITLRSSDGPEVTVIDGGNPSPWYWGSVVAFKDHEGPDCVLEGFTLTNGSGTRSNKVDYYHGGGIYCYHASPTLKNLIITGNHAYNGGGVYCDYSSNPTMIDNVITDNYVTGSYSNGMGGGIYCGSSFTQLTNQYICGNSATTGGGIACSGSTITISNNTILENSADDGGGIWCSSSSALTIINNTICMNTAENGGGICTKPQYSNPSCVVIIKNNSITQNSVELDGGGLWLRCDDSSIISTNLISDNSADNDGGGIYWEESSPFFKNNVITGNTSGCRGGGLYGRKTTSFLSNNIIAANSSDYGGGFYCYTSDFLLISGSTFADNIAVETGGGMALKTTTNTTVTNSIFWNNSAPAGPEILVGDNHLAELSIAYSDVKGGQTSVEVNPGCTLRWGNGMIDSDPLFAEPARRDYHLKQEPCHPGEHSPCVDSGDPEALFGGATRADSIRDIYPADMGSHYPPDSPFEFHVSGKNANIQTAINGTWDGDSVIVHPGTYVENIDFKGNAIHVKSSDGAASTGIDGGMPLNPESGSVVTFNMSEGADSILEGFSLKNGTGNLADLNGIENRYYGGGISCINGSPTIRNNVVTENSADYGGGIYCYHAHVMLEDNIISDNTGVYQGGGFCSFESSPLLSYNTITNNTATNGPGGGISCEEESEPVITNNTISGNMARSGGGIHCLTDCDVTLTNNTIKNNAAAELGGGLFIDDYCNMVMMDNSITNNYAQFGGGIAFWRCSSMTFMNNMILANTALQSGGGIHCVFSGISKVQNNTIAKNTAKSGGGICCTDYSNITSLNNTIWGNSADSGGGLYIVNGSAPKVVNTILSKNTAAQGAEIELRGGFHPASLTISHSLVEGGVSMIHFDPDCSLSIAEGVITADPRLINPENNDFHLSFPSPCRGAGDNLAKYLPDIDFEGDPRISQEIVDMGVDEFHAHFYCTGNFTPGGSIAGKFIGFAGTFPVGLFIGSGVMDPPLHHMWGDFFLEAPWMLVPLVSIPPDGVLVVSTSLPVAPVAPYDIPLQALIGNTLSNLFILEVK